MRDSFIFSFLNGVAICYPLFLIKCSRETFGGVKMKNDGYYHCDRLLTLKDKNGKTPDIYIVDGNRTAGKSYSIKCRQVSDFLKDKYRPENQFIYLYRNVVDMKNCADTYLVIYLKNLTGMS
jgi:hypothetical protein